MKLKPCPFCGNEVELERHSDPRPTDFDYEEGKEYPPSYYITCRYCTGPKDNLRKRSEWWRIACVNGPTPEVVAERWNDRPPRQQWVREFRYSND
jgi:hypothetical protein